VIETILEAILACVIAIVFWVVLTPIVFAVGTFPILYLALLGKGEYVENLRHEYRRLWEFWKERGLFLTPPW
jgi:hypothetical protein